MVKLSIKTCQSGGMAPLFLTSAEMEVSRQLHAPATLQPGKEPPVSIEQNAWWAPEPVWTLWSKEKSLAPAGNRIPAVHTVTGRYTE
jgi:hypothetical protein